MAEQKVKAETTNSSSKVNSSSSYGWRQAPTTMLFRITNFELFVKPNKPVMFAGISMFVGCVAYIIFMNLNDDKKSRTYVSVAEDGSLIKRQRTSRWD
ncbi:Hypothetical predicted protein [Octopus vulgaris]|uniref:Uncharacterized protein n=2 Tax=Octopus TaxID=6643 RepID=A0AA36FHA6_OCTVU|nr:small integral membrane protein 8 [Octopus sinensis]CAI9739041.1 Hypothetical predicted protein [Octopus vulgaris]